MSQGVTQVNKRISPADEVQSEIYRKMSPAKKWEAAYHLRELAWQMKAAAIRTKHPEWSEATINNEVKKIFLYAVT